MEWLRLRHGVAALLVAGLVVLAVVLLDPAGSETGDAPSAGASPSASTTSTPAPPPPRARTATVEEYCAAFADFALANGEALSNPAALGDLEVAAEDLVATGAPEDMSDTAWAGQQVLVADTLAALGAATATPSPVPTPPGAVDEFNRYLATTCPLA